MNASINWVTSLAELTASGLILWSFQALVLIALVRLLLSVWPSEITGSASSHLGPCSCLAIALLPLAPLIPMRSPQARLKAIALSYLKPASDSVSSHTAASGARPSVSLNNDRQFTAVCPSGDPPESSAVRATADLFLPGFLGVTDSGVEAHPRPGDAPLTLPKRISR
jgi:hypothetical protein